MEGISDNIVDYFSKARVFGAGNGGC